MRLRCAQPGFFKARRKRFAQSGGEREEGLDNLESGYKSKSSSLICGLAGTGSAGLG